LRHSIVVLAALLVTSCGASPSAPAPAQQPQQQQPPPSQPPPADTTPYWDVAVQGIPRLTTHNYIDLARIHEVSRFRSGVGHDYWDDFERCRSMKHYFMTPQDSSAETVGIYAPFDGEIVRTLQEWAGVQLEIQSKAYPAFTAVLFHVNPAAGIGVGTQVTGGQRLGSHIGSQTMSDITISVSESGGRRLVSWFLTMTDGVFALYQARGMTSRDQAVITKEERDASPLSCTGEFFANSGTLPNWVHLN
jgi:hypothetical protein